MSREFSFTEEELKVLTNFVQINPNMVFQLEGFSVVNERKSVIAYYTFEKEYDYEVFGIGLCDEFLNIVKGISNFKLKTSDTCIDIIDVNSAEKGKSYNKIRYNLTPLKILPKVSNKVPENFKEQGDPNLEFILTSENLAKLKKISAVLKLQRLFIQNGINDNLQLIAGTGKELDSSTNQFEINIDKDFVNHNDLEDKILSLTVNDINSLIDGEYKVKLSLMEDKGISHWHNNLSPTIDYYIGLSVENDKNG